ncbi:MAG: MFS transporter [Armatimonadetes bacterium]|nr:MFS transporter [Armatimonadota bacterium]HOC32420.1 MFS transporter [Armatimonadota bacterium]
MTESPTIIRNPDDPWARMMRQPLWRRLSGLVLVSLFCEIAMAVVVTFALPLYLNEHLRWREDDVGPVTSAFLLAETITKPFFAWISDRFGRKILIVFGIALSSFAVYRMSTATGHWEFITLSALNGIGGAALWPNVFAAVADVTSERERVGSMSVFNMMYMIGLGLGPVVGSVVYRLAAAGRANTAPAWLWIPSRESDIFRVTTGILLIALVSALFLIPWLHHKHATAGSAPGLRNIPVRWPVLGFFMAMSFFQTLGIQLLNNPLVFYLRQVLKLDAGDIGLPFILLGAAVAVLAIPVGTWGGKWGRVRSVKLGIGVAALGMILLPLRPSLGYFMIIAVPMILGFLLCIPAWLAMITELAPPAYRGRIYGWVVTMQGLGAAFGPWLGTKVLVKVGHHAPFMLSGIVLGTTLLAALFFLREGMRAVDDPAVAGVPVS